MNRKKVMTFEKLQKVMATEIKKNGGLVILSTPMLIETGKYRMREINLKQAKQLMENAGEYKNFCGHQTVKILGIEPAKTRKNCTGYYQAIVIKPNQRLEFGKEYTIDDISKIGYKIYLITKVV